MRRLKLNAWERVMLTQCLPQQAPLAQVPMFVRIIETLRLKEEEQKLVGWRADPDQGTVSVRDAATEFDIELEDADFAALATCANQWDGWPVAPESIALTAKLNEAAK